MAKAVGYIRVSTQDQVREGWGLSAQRSRVKAYCEARGWKLARIYADEGISGSGEKRPAYERMVRDVLADGVEYVVALKLDRLGRSAKGLLDLYDGLERKGVNLVAIEDNIDTSTPQGRLMRTLLAAFAEFEKDMIRQRTKNGVAAARASGKYVGRPPYGWQVIDGQLVRHFEEQKLLARIRKMSHGGQSARQIAIRLNEEGIQARGTARSDHQASWHAKTVLRVLNAPKRPDKIRH